MNPQFKFERSRVRSSLRKASVARQVGASAVAGIGISAVMYVMHCARSGSSLVRAPESGEASKGGSSGFRRWALSRSLGIRELAGLVEPLHEKRYARRLLASELGGLYCPSCVGLAHRSGANTHALEGLFDMGFGFVETRPTSSKVGSLKERLLNAT